MLTCLLFFILIACKTFSQTDWVRWGKADISYEIQYDFEERDYNLTINSSSDIVLKPLVNSYWFFISDVDGANCPFSPSCSSFFLESAEDTNPAQALLMFFDRFTRDTNFANRHEHYPTANDGRFYDPISLYKLDAEKINYIPPNSHLDK